MGILSCNCKISAMEVGPACAINENAYGGYDGLCSGVAWGMCYKLTPYGTSETDQWPKSEDDLPGPMVFKVTGKYIFLIMKFKIESSFKIYLYIY
jgi:hypothetical protein